MAVKTINSVRNALVVLEALAAAQPIGVSALSRQVDLDKAGVQRILLTLQESGWVHQSDGGEWMLTSRSLQVGAGFSAGLREVAHPHLTDLQRLTGETALLFAFERATLVLIDAVDSSQVLRTSVPVGTVVPLEKSRAFDLFLPDNMREGLPEASTPASAASAATVLRQGWFLIDQLYPISVAVGAPILLSPEPGAVPPLGAFVVVGPKARIPKSAVKDIAVHVSAAARAVSAVFGGRDT